jgi:hypothetical protein
MIGTRTALLPKKYPLTQTLVASGDSEKSRQRPGVRFVCEAHKLLPVLSSYTAFHSLAPAHNPFSQSTHYKRHALNPPILPLPASSPSPHRGQPKIAQRLQPWDQPQTIQVPAGRKRFTLIVGAIESGTGIYYPKVAPNYILNT